MNLVNAVTSGSIWNIGRIDIKFHKKAINGSLIEFFSLITLSVGHRRQPGLLWPSVPAKEGTRDSLNLVVSGHKQLWSPPAANRLPMWLRNYSSIGHSFNCSKWHCLRPGDAWGRGWGGGKVAAAVRDRVCSPEQLTDHAGTRERMVVSLWARLHLRLLPASCFTRTLYIVLEKIEIFLEKCFFFFEKFNFFLSFCKLWIFKILKKKAINGRGN